MPRLPVVFIHGYSRDERDFDNLRAALIEQGHAERDLHSVRFRSFSDEVSVRRLADALEAALAARLRGNSFDAIVHSTGALIIREWLRQSPDARERLHNLVTLAPANFGSPVAPLARSALGRASMAFSRARSGDFEFLTPWSENFLDVGDRLLVDLELASPISWSLASSEIDDARWGAGNGSGGNPRVFPIGGLAEYSDRAMRRRRPGAGTDGTVRLAGIGLDVDRLRLDLRPTADDSERISFNRAPDQMARPLLVAGLNHQTICTGGGDDLEPAFSLVTDAIGRALDVDSAAKYAKWAEKAATDTVEQMALTHRWSWQQFLVRMQDEAGEPVECDWTLQLDVDGKTVGWLEKGAHTNSARPDLHCLDVPVTDELRTGRELVIRVLVDPETDHFAYRGVGVDDGPSSAAAAEIVVPLGGKDAIRMFRTMATTLIDIVIEGVAPDQRSGNAILSFVD